MVGKPFEVIAYQGDDTNDWGDSIDDFPLHSADNPPAVISIDYDNEDVQGLDETALKLYQLNETIWWEPVDQIYPALGDQYHFLADTLIAVPVCKTGIFAFNVTTPGNVCRRKLNSAPHPFQVQVL